eukprot:12429427-Karenia_brevis.AAC.1
MALDYKTIAIHDEPIKYSSAAPFFWTRLMKATKNAAYTGLILNLGLVQSRVVQAQDFQTSKDRQTD